MTKKWLGSNSWKNSMSFRCNSFFTSSKNQVLSKCEISTENCRLPVCNSCVRMSATLGKFSPDAKRGSSLIACLRIYNQKRRNNNVDICFLISSPTTCKSLTWWCTHGYILILTQIELCVDGCIGQLWKTAEKFRNELCSQSLLLWTPFNAIQNYLISIFVLKKKEKKWHLVILILNNNDKGN